MPPRTPSTCPARALLDADNRDTTSQGLLMKHMSITAALVASLVAGQAHASMAVYSDKAAYLAATGATLATTPYPNTGNSSHLGLSSGSVSFTAVAESSYTTGYLYFGDWSARLPGNEISINAFEDLDVAFAAPVHAFGFDFVEPQFDPNIGDTFQDSTFTVTLRQGTTAVGSFTFNAPNDVAAFVGASNTLAFNNVQIRETIGGVEDEFFGQFYTAATTPSPTPMPEPATPTLLLAGLAGIGALQRRRQAR